MLFSCFCFLFFVLFFVCLKSFFFFFLVHKYHGMDDPTLPPPPSPLSLSLSLCLSPSLSLPPLSFLCVHTPTPFSPSPSPLLDPSLSSDRGRQRSRPDSGRCSLNASLQRLKSPASGFRWRVGRCISWVQTLSRQTVNTGLQQDKPGK